MKPKILLVDDEDLVVKSISKLLAREGYDVLISRSGEEAISMAKDQNIDLIVCDIRMPQLNGVETIKQIREILKTKKHKLIKEILITGYAEDETNRAAEDLHVADYIYKPFDMRDFLACVKKNLED